MADPSGRPWIATRRGFAKDPGRGLGGTPARAVPGGREDLVEQALGLSQLADLAESGDLSGMSPQLFDVTSREGAALDQLLRKLALRADDGGLGGARERRPCREAHEDEAPRGAPTPAA